MVPTFESKTLITDLYSMNPPDSRGYYFLPPYDLSMHFAQNSWVQDVLFIMGFTFNG
jgi:hypothetical protein